MTKKKRKIDIDDILEKEQLNNENNDMIFVSATEEQPISPVEARQMSRLERIRSSAVNVDEPLFDGETELDLGKITLNNEEDAQQIKHLEEQKKISMASDNTRDKIVDDMHGIEVEDVIADFGLDINTVPAEQINRKVEKKANSKAVQEILDQLHKE